MSYTNGLDKPSDYFNTKLYTGNGSSQSISSVGFKPDWNWIKRRNTADSHRIQDSVRGSTKYLSSNSTDNEVDAGSVSSFDTDGFTLSSSDSKYNGSGSTYASWNWLASNTTASNTDGSITSTVSANTTSGFSIVNWTHNGGNSTIGHGLGVAPKVIITKERNNTGSWNSYFSAVGNGHRMVLQGTNAKISSSIWNSTNPTSTVFSMNDSITSTMIAYCFADVKGYSKFGSYTGNGSTDGTFVYTGFKPAFTIIKRTDATDNWFIQDNIRQANANFDGNPVNIVIQGDSTNAETNASSRSVDYLSNGFKIRTTNGGWNASGGNFIYMAFAENPFVTSTGIPCTAR